MKKELDAAVEKSRQGRVHAELAVQLLDGAESQFQGLTRDLSLTGFSAFLKRIHSVGLAEPINYSLLTPGEIRRSLAGKELSAVLEMGLSIGPAAVEVVRVENSWLKDFDMFVAFNFKTLNDGEKTAIARYVEEHEEDREPVPVHPEEKIHREKLGETDVIRISIPARYFYLSHMRNLCERLALEMGFSKTEAMRIKVSFDEVLTNAFKHGCKNYGHDKISIQISFDDAGIFVHIRDPGGRPFDYKKYREFDKKFPDSSRTGLHLVDKFSDGWAVNTKLGKYTEVSFFKNRPQSDQEEKG